MFSACFSVPFFSKGERKIDDDGDKTSRLKKRQAQDAPPFFKVHWQRHSYLYKGSITSIIAGERKISWGPSECVIFM